MQFNRCVFLKNPPSKMKIFYTFFFLLLLLALLISGRQMNSRIQTTTLLTRPVGIMGTTCSLCVVVKNCDLQRGNRLLKEAEWKLRECEMLTSTWIETSEISRLNAAKAGEIVRLSPFTMAFLRKACEAYEQTDGAFDITCGRLWLHWKACEKENRLPTQEELDAIRAESNWNNLELGQPGTPEENSVTKRADGVCVVTGGLAKGMAIDEALKTLTNDGVALHAFVEVGGDVATFLYEKPVQIAGPEKKTVVCPNGGVCTSGHTARFFEIQGQRFSQILNPQTGQPVPRRWEITVTAPDSSTADYWATALEVLGKEGVSILPENIKAEFLSTK